MRSGQPLRTDRSRAARPSPDGSQHETMEGNQPADCPLGIGIHLKQPGNVVDRPPRSQSGRPWAARKARSALRAAEAPAGPRTAPCATTLVVAGRIVGGAGNRGGQAQRLRGDEIGAHCHTKRISLRGSCPRPRQRHGSKQQLRSGWPSRSPSRRGGRAGERAGYGLA
jgi:hypothetical protein